MTPNRENRHLRVLSDLAEVEDPMKTRADRIGNFSESDTIGVRGFIFSMGARAQISHSMTSQPQLARRNLVLKEPVYGYFHQLLSVQAEQMVAVCYSLPGKFS